MKKQQVLVLHGGNSFATHGAYIHDLSTKDWKLERMRAHDDWKHALQNDLGEAYDVLQPKLPAHNAQYAEWKIIFEGILSRLDADVIVIGHSLGGIFLAKYFSENTARTLVRALFIVAAPFHDPELAQFAIPDDLSPIVAQVPAVFFYHSTDDMVVPYADLEKYKTALPDIHDTSFTDRGHFNGTSFPELLADLHALDTTHN